MPTKVAGLDDGYSHDPAVGRSPHILVRDGEITVFGVVSASGATIDRIHKLSRMVHEHRIRDRNKFILLQNLLGL